MRDLMLLIILLLHIWISGQTTAGNTFIVRCMQEFANAWQNACQTPDGVVSVPAGKTIFLSGGHFVGPCNGTTTFQVDGTLVASGDPKLDALQYWIGFESIDRLRVVGRGVFDGNGASSWSRCGSPSSCARRRRPASLWFHKVRDVVIQGISSRNSKMFHLKIHRSGDVRVRNVTLTSPADSPNTDGIHLSKAVGVQIADSSIATGDDCVSLGEGCRDVNITRVACGPGHGFSIGSLGKYAGEEDVGGVRVTGCNMSGTDNGLRIKTWAPSLSSNVVSDVTFSDITLRRVKNPIVIDQRYCPHGDCLRDGGESSVQVMGVRYVNIRGSSATERVIDVQCSLSRPCRDVVFDRVDLSFNGLPRATVARCANVDSRFEGSNPSRCY